MVEHAREDLADRLKKGIADTGVSIDTLADRTKIPRSTIRKLAGETVSAVLPERVYLRGQLNVISLELGLDPTEMLALFDHENPRSIDTTDLARTRRFGMGTGNFALVACLGGVAILAVVLAFASAIG